MAWKIARMSGSVTHYEIRDGWDMIRGLIFFKPATGKHHVNMDAPAFNWECNSLDQAIGYVRGVERSVQVHRKETAT